MSISSSEQMVVPESVATQLHEIADPNQREMIEKQVGLLSVVATEKLDEPFGRYNVHAEINGEPIPHALQPATELLMINIARRAGEYSRTAPAEKQEPDMLWRSIAEGQLTDIATAKNFGENQRTENLILEHMATLNIMVGSREDDPESRHAELDQHAEYSLLKLTELGLAENVVKVSRQAYGIVAAEARQPLFYEEEKNGQPVKQVHELHSVAHTFERAFPALEVGLGKTISVDPAEKVAAHIRPTAEVINSLNTIESAIAVTVRSRAQQNVQSEIAEDSKLITTLMHHGLEAMTTEDEFGLPTPAVNDAASLEAFAVAAPALLGKDYQDDFARLRQERLVGSSYRRPASPRLDNSIVQLVADGHDGIAQSLITASAAEIVDGRGEDGGILLRAVSDVPLDIFDPQKRVEITDTLKAMQQAKAQRLEADMEHTLSALDLSSWGRNELQHAIRNAHDGESALASVQLLRQALEGTTDQSTADQLIRTLCQETGTNDATVLDEMGAHAHALAPILVSPEFSVLTRNKEFGKSVQTQVLRHPEQIKDIVAVMGEPGIQRIIAEEHNESIIQVIIKDPTLNKKVIENLQSLGASADLFDTEQLASLMQADTTGAYVKDLQASESFKTLEPADRKMIIWQGYALPLAVQQKIAGNMGAAREVLQSWQSLGGTGMYPQSQDYLLQSLLRADHPQDMAAHLNEVASQTTLPGLIAGGGAAYEVSQALLEDILTSSDPLAAARAATERIEGIVPLFKRIQEANVLPAAQTTLAQMLVLDSARGKDVAQLVAALDDSKLLSLIGQEGPAYTFGETLVDTITRSDNPEATAHTIADQLLANDPLWLQCYKISQIALGSIEDIGYQKGLTIHDIPLSLPVPSLTAEQQMKVLQENAPVPFAEMSVEQKRSVARLTGLEDAAVANLQEVSFSDLTPEYKQALLAHRLFETITLSRDEASRQIASERNRSHARDEWLRTGDLVHATDKTASLRAMLNSGALAGEALGFANSSTDTFPFNLDTVVASAGITQMDTYGQQVNALQNTGYGNIELVFGRGPGALHKDEEFEGHVNSDHRLVLGGLPATEVSRILLRGNIKPDGIDDVKRVVAEAGIYIPVFGPTGDLILDPTEYERLQDDLNVRAVQPEIIDNGYKRANSQAGSNEGAEFVMGSGREQQPSRWYVKFGDHNPDHLWNELLADSLYRAVKPDSVPVTKAVVIEGRLARASKMVPVDGGAVTPEARNTMFAMDCLLGNWDAVYNADNIIMSGGNGLRGDNGNTLDYLARGNKKDAGTFTEVVQELESGSNKARLGEGMRQMYPDITAESIAEQIADVRTNLTDSVIDNLVDGVRLPSTDRQRYKYLLKSRRDYIIEYFANLTS